MLRGPEQDFYMVVIKLESAIAAANFVTEFHKRRFNEIESEACFV